MRNPFNLFLFILMLLAMISSFTPKNINFIQSKNSDLDYNYATSLIEPNLDGKKFVSSVIKINFEVDPNTPQRRITDMSTGFSVYYDKKEDVSYILSNNHFCIEAINSILPGHLFYENSQTIMSQKIQFNSGEIEIIDTDPSKDLCLLSAEGFVKPVEFVSDNYKIQQMDLVVTVGAPGGIFPIIRKTFISNFHKRDAFPDDMVLGENLLLLSDSVFPGQSGSPLFNLHGKVIGIVCMNLSNNGQVIYGGLAIPYQDIKGFLKKNEIY